MSNKIRVLTIVVTIILSQFGCASNEQQPDPLYDAHEITPVYTSQLIHELNSNPNEVGFGQIIHLELLYDGHFLINDVLGRTLHKFDKDGQLLSQISREGRGPGEFLSMNIQSDATLGWMGIYDPIQSKATILDINLENIIMNFEVVNPVDYSIEWLGFNSIGAFFQGSKGYTLQNYSELRTLDIFYQEFENDSLEFIQSVPGTEYHATVNLENRSIFLNYLPMGRRVSLNPYDDHFVYISNDGFGYSLIDHTGETVFTDSLTSIIDLNPYRFDDRQIELHIDRLLGFLSEEFISEVRNDLRQNMNRNKLLWFQNSFTDLNGRIWFELYPELFENESRWIVWDIVDNDVFQVLFEESNVRPQNALDDRVVAFKRNEFDLETVQIYRFHP